MRVLSDVVKCTEGCRVIALGCFLLGLCFCGAPIMAAGDQGTPVATNSPQAFSSTELEELASPIALYPDKLIQVMLPAATFPEQIIDASLLIKTSKDAPFIDTMDWDPSVKAVASFPGILKMMSEKLDWTTNLGQAFLGQHQQLLSAIQDLRARAKEVGNLKTTSNQKVVTEAAPGGETIIRVESASPEVVYVPTYNPAVVYSEPEPSYSLSPLVTFGAGMALGSMLDDDDDDVNVYYGGGGGGFWYNDDVYDNWVDHRNDRWNDVNDYYKDRQDFRQDTVSKGQDFRQDYYKEHGKYPTSADRQQAVNTRKQEAQNRAQNLSPEQRSQLQGAANERRTASAGSQTWGAQQRTATTRSAGSAGYSKSAFQGYSSGKVASSYGSRGAQSRASSAHYGGGGRAGGGGFSGRGGGGMARGGGGGRRR